MSEFMLYGKPAHLVLEDEDGAFEVVGGLRLTDAGTVDVNMARTLTAIDERIYGNRPAFREVEFHV